MKPEDFQAQIQRMTARLQEVETRLADPDVYARPSESRALSRERQRLQQIFALYENWTKAEADIAENESLLASERDPEFRTLIESDLESCRNQAAESEKKLLCAFIPPDPNDGRGAIMELKPAAGGEEAALFAAEMYRMYTHYAEHRGWKADVLSLEVTELGGIKDVSMLLTGDDVFSRLKYESGVHRVQRVPATEASGRIHTSTITVSVLPEAEETDDIAIRPEDLEVSTFHSSGPGGQKVNKTDSAVRIVHKPSGLVVASQQERSQIRNREIALHILKSKLLEIRRTEELTQQAASKRQQVGTGDRSERIRTYNFPQNRITDHRYDGVSAFNLPALMEGNLDLILDPLFERADRDAVEYMLKEILTK